MGVTSRAAAELRGGSAGCRRVAENSVISAHYANTKKKGGGGGSEGEGRRGVAGSLAQARAHVPAPSP